MPTTEFEINAVEKEFVSDSVPNYSSSIFHMRDYSMLKINTEIVYSQPMQVGSLQWRLKVYPNGNGASEG